MRFDRAAIRREPWVVWFVAIAVLWIAGGLAANAEPLTFDERVAARRAIEEVRWRHRLWPGTNPGPKPPLAALLSDEHLRALVSEGLGKEALLASEWGVTLSAPALQEELDRMAEATRRPDRLAELFEALGNDPARIAECLVKPILADRRIRAAYARDARFHGALKSAVEAELRGVKSPARLGALGGAYAEVEWVRQGSERLLDRSPDTQRQRIVVPDRDWSRTLVRWSDDGLLAGAVGRLRELDDRFVVLGALERDEDRVVVASVTWKKVPFDAWWATASPASDLDLPAGPTGEVGRPAAAAAGCSGDSWTATAHGPSGRFGHTAVWTGNEMIVWGGFMDAAPLDTGGRYDPATDSWSTLTALGAPSARSDHTSVWTGSEMIVWGGSSGGPFYLDSGARFDPGAGTWTATSSSGAPTARYEQTAIWADGEMVVWGGFDGATPYADSGAVYDPDQDTWGTTSMTGAPEGRWHHTAVWTGDEMIVWGGEGDGGSLATGGRYSPAGDSWTATSDVAAPESRDSHAAAWTGSEMIVWGGFQDYVFHLDTGGSYDPAQETWRSTSTTGAPEARYGHTAVWADGEMIVWGGIGSEFGLDTGGRYCAGTDESIHLTLDADGTDSLLAWTGVGDAIGYDVVRGDVAALQTSGGDFSVATEACLLDDVDLLGLVDSDPLGTAEGFWYLVRPVLTTGPGSYDSGGPAQAMSRDAGINGSGQSCP